MMANRDRYGDKIEDEQTAQVIPLPVQMHDPTCRSGWLPPDSEGRPRVCPTCRPSTARRLRQQRYRDFDDASAVAR